MTSYFTKIIFVLTLMWSIYGNCQDRHSYAEEWKSWDNYTRDVFLYGFIEGSSKAYIITSQNWLTSDDYVGNSEPYKVKKVREEIFLFYEPAVIRDVITQLYKDPSNSYIPPSSMALLARDKLRGDDIESSLREERKRAHELYLFEKKLKK